eukprot:scaffold259898_cov27-Tisochrysis_lutea.AAC.3
MLARTPLDELATEALNGSAYAWRLRPRRYCGDGERWRSRARWARDSPDNRACGARVLARGGSGAIRIRRQHAHAAG